MLMGFSEDDKDHTYETMSKEEVEKARAEGEPLLERL